jgi:signal peptidase I
MQKNFENSLIIGLAMTLGVGVTGFVAYAVFLSFDAGRAMFSRNPSRSMEPTLLAGDYIASRRLNGVARELRRGDVIAFQFPDDPTKQFMKRIIGMPGDTVAMQDGQVLLNGRPLHESYLAARSDSIDPAPEEFRWQRRYLVGTARADTTRYLPSRDNWGPLLVPTNSFFVLGDRRDESLDSRYFGFVSSEKVLAKARRIYFSRDEDGSIRWSRLGQLVH